MLKIFMVLCPKIQNSIVYMFFYYNLKAQLRIHLAIFSTFNNDKCSKKRFFKRYP